MQALPVDQIIPQIIETLKSESNLVVQAPPGSGKTTRIPRAILDAGVTGGREVLVLEPRRLAARMAARRVADEHGEMLGGTVGYQVRFDEVSGPETRLRFLTEGVLTRRLLSDTNLSSVGAVVLDEFHERHLQADLAIALLRRLQQGSRPDLRIVVMSATLQAEKISNFLGGCKVLHAEGQRFEVTTEHQLRQDDSPLSMQVAGAVRRLVNEGLAGDVLVFLPGAAEIRRSIASCAAVAAESDLTVVALHGEMSADEQDRAVRPGPKRKIILSTNVAESSITVEGVAAVIDSGLARIAGHSPWSGLPVLNVGRISKASAIQRAGRAGRIRAGRCLRLYTMQDFGARPDHDAPEIMRVDLAEPVLELHGSGIRDLNSFEWFEQPPATAVLAGEDLLKDLGALHTGGDTAGDTAGAITKVGTRMLRLPVHPRLSRLLVEAEMKGVGADGCLIAALISERDIRLSESFETARSHSVQPARQHGSTDLLQLVDLFKKAEGANFSASRVRALGLDVGRVKTVDRVRSQLTRLVGARNGTTGPLSPAQEEALSIAVLTGYPDRVAQRRSSDEVRRNGEVELLLSGGGSARLAGSSGIADAALLVAVQAEETAIPGRSSRGGVHVKLASAIEPEWLLELYPNKISESTTAFWNRESCRVEVVERILYGNLVLDEVRKSNVRNEQTARMLADVAREAGLNSVGSGEEIDQLLLRLEFMRRTFPENDFPSIGATEVEECFNILCKDRLSFAELRSAIEGGELRQCIHRMMSTEQLRLLEKMAPARIQLGARRALRVNYVAGQTPWIASRIQDFFGMSESPTVGGGRVPLVLHLLAPNQRPVQITTDLKGFWQRHYPQVRRELGRRYPRHSWPENPMI
jgi:ATP-dependent helicase HrpB